MRNRLTLKHLLFLLALPACTEDAPPDAGRLDQGVRGAEEPKVAAKQKDPQEARFAAFKPDPTLCLTDQQMDAFRQKAGNAPIGNGGGCIEGHLPPTKELAPSYHDMNASERRGLAAWHLFSSDGGFLRQINKSSHGGVNSLRSLDYHPERSGEHGAVARNKRFQTFGTFNDPGCRPRTKADGPDAFGLWLDICEDPYSSGILGLRLKPNPNFNMKRWIALGEADEDGFDLNRDPDFEDDPEETVSLAATRHFTDPTLKYELEWRDSSGRKVKEEVEGWEVEPPYLPALACTACHLAADPLNPPKDPNDPEWDELVFAIGNQYLREGALLGYFLRDRQKPLSRFHQGQDFARELLLSQQPGTSDTSRVATDHYFNPNTINSVANLRSRPLYVERASKTFNPDKIPCALASKADDVGRAGEGVSARGIELGAQKARSVGPLLDALLAIEASQFTDEPLPDPRSPEGECVPMVRVLKSGDDSSGPTGALLRVYINIGACDEEFFAAAGDFLEGEAGQVPISRKQLIAQCAEYREMAVRSLDTLNYLAYVKPYKLLDAPGGLDHVENSTAQAVEEFPNAGWQNSVDVLKEGRRVFAERCATCHSSAQPLDEVSVFDTDDWFTDERTAFFHDALGVAGDEGSIEELAGQSWLLDDFLADDRRYPLDIVGTNHSRALATNATKDRVWAEYSSETYKTDLPRVRLPLSKFELDIPNIPDFLVSRDEDVEGDTALAGRGRGYLRTPSLVNVWSSAPFLHQNGLGCYLGPIPEGMVNTKEKCPKGKNHGISVADRLVAYTDAAEKLLGLKTRGGMKSARVVGEESVLVLAGILRTTIEKGEFIDIFANLGVLVGRGEGEKGRFGEETDRENVEQYRLGTDLRQDKGHDGPLFGGDLADHEKRAVIEFMKLM